MIKEISWAFRVASKKSDGAGHVKRCLPLAKELTRRGLEVSFILDQENELFYELIQTNNMNLLLVNDDNINNSIWDGVVLDGYHFKKEDVSFWKKRTNTTVMIVDDQPVNELGGLLDYIVNPSSSLLNNAESASVSCHKILSGPEYYLIDDKFLSKQYEVDDCNAKSILVSCGYIDTKCINPYVLDAITCDEMKSYDLSINVAVGPHSPCIENLLSTSKKHENVMINKSNDIFNLMSDADIVIGGGGVSLLERTAYGIPSITIVVAENQKTQVEWVTKHDATINAGSFENIQIEHFKDSVINLIKNYKLRKKLSDNAKNLIDGLGVERITNEIIYH
jgi:UDP-2,4-diacetamido-2,4,6-trideoxy-beta-L-altropyranose hydrolase